MECEKIKKLIPCYLEKDLQLDEYQYVKNHLRGCSVCQNEVEAFEKSWDILSTWQNIEPRPDYVSRFWTEISLRKPWYEKVWEHVSGVVIQKRLAPTFIAVCLMIIVGIFSLQNYFQVQDSERLLAGLTTEELEMVEYMELAENYEIIEDLDFLEDLEIIENLDTLEGFDA